MKYASNIQNFNHLVKLHKLIDVGIKLRFSNYDSDDLKQDLKDEWDRCFHDYINGTKEGC